MLVAAVIVCYFPDIERVAGQLKILAAQACSIVLVNNGPVDDALEQLVLDHGGGYLQQTENVGVAAGFNAGLYGVLKTDAEYAITLDQDSLPSKTMISDLVMASEDLIADGKKLAAVGPSLRDVKGNTYSGFVVREGLILRSQPAQGIVETDFLISSGMLIRTSVIRDVGFMNPDLFIDAVDHEWCLRAITKGYVLYGVGEAFMEHDLGEEVIEFGGGRVSVHKPFRYYYMVRNGLWLSRQRWLAKEWRAEEFYRAIHTYIVYSFFAGKCLDNWKMMTKGVFHALLGRMGPLTSPQKREP